MSHTSMQICLIWFKRNCKPTFFPFLLWMLKSICITALFINQHTYQQNVSQNPIFALFSIYLMYQEIMDRCIAKEKKNEINYFWLWKSEIVKCFFLLKNIFYRLICNFWKYNCKCKRCFNLHARTWWMNAT